MNNDIFNHIINRLLSNANDTLKDAQANDKDEFYVGKKLAYYEVLDTIKNDLISLSNHILPIQVEIESTLTKVVVPNS